MAQEQPSTSPPPPPFGELQAPTEALFLLVGRLTIEGIAKDHMIRGLMAEIAASKEKAE